MPNEEASHTNNSSPSPRPGISTEYAKRILLLCWLMAVCHIWLASDGSDSFFDVTDYDGLVDERLRIEGYAPSRDENVDFLVRRQMNQEIRSEAQQVNSDLRSIPEALHPITYNECCIPAIFNGTKNPPDLKCFGTCYNERACHDPSYPYSSMEEKIKYGSRREYRKELEELRRRCLFRPDYLVPNVTWCSASDDELKMDDVPAKVTENSKNSSSTSIFGDIPKPGCSFVSGGGGSGPWQHVIIFPKVKLAFCGIPKVGITQWIQFSRFIAGAKDYPSLPHYKLDTDFFRFDKLTSSLQEEIYSDKAWTWAVFLRDPAERLLSAYLDKIVKVDAQSKIQKALGYNSTVLDGFTFQDFVDRLGMEYNGTGCKGVYNMSNPLTGMTGLNWCSDPHWRPQIMSCGISSHLDRFQFVGDINNAPHHTRELLQRVGLWETHGKHFINGGINKEGNKTISMCRVKSHPYNHTSHVGFQQKDERNSTAANTAWGHSKNSQSKLDKYYTPELLKFVREKLYADDYKLYSLVSEKKLTSGKELAMELSGSSC